MNHATPFQSSRVLRWSADSTALDSAMQTSAELLAPLVYGAWPVHDETRPRSTGHLVADDQVAPTRTHSGTAAAEVRQRHPDQLVATTNFVLALLEDVDDADAELHPITHLFAGLNASLDRCNDINPLLYQLSKKNLRKIFILPLGTTVQ